MSQSRNGTATVVIVSGAALLCGVAMSGCAAREAAPRLSAAEHDALAAQAASRGEGGAVEANEHRVAAQELRSAEEWACAGVPATERNAGPFPTAGEVIKVEPLSESLRVGKVFYPTVVGSKITVLAGPGVTKQWFTRLAECHAARHASLGPSVDDGKPCPFSSGAVRFRVAEAPTSFVVSVRSEQGSEGAEHVLHQSLALLDRDVRTADKPSGGRF